MATFVIIMGCLFALGFGSVLARHNAYAASRPTRRDDE